MGRGTTLEIRKFPKIIVSYAYIFWWALRAYVRYYVDKWAAFFLGAFVIYALAEVAVELAGKSWGTSPSVTFRSIFFLLIGVSLYSKVREWSEKRQQFYFIQAAKEVTKILGSTSELPPAQIIPQLLAIFSKTFEGKKKFWAFFVQAKDRKKDGMPDASVTLLGNNGKLHIAHWHPPNTPYLSRLHAEGFAFLEGEGGCGYACEKRAVVYFPRKNLGHAIIQNFEDEHPYSVEPDLFVWSGADDFQAVLSVPLVAYGACYGSLNFASEKPNAFQRLDFEQAMFYGLVLAQVLHLSGRGR